MEALGDFEEIVAAGDDLPLGLHLEFIHEGDKAVQDFCYAASHSSGVDHLHRAPAQSLREETELIQLGFADDRLIIAQLRWRRRRRRRLGNLRPGPFATLDRGSRGDGAPAILRWFLLLVHNSRTLTVF